MKKGDSEKQIMIAAALRGGWPAAMKALDGYESNGLAGWQYTGKRDVRPLAALLMALHPVPDDVAARLSLMLDPPPGYRDARLKVVSPSVRNDRSLWLELARKREARAKYQKLTDGGGLHKNAVADLQKEYGVKRTWVTDAIALDDEKFIAAGKEGLSSRNRKPRKSVNPVGS